MPRKPLDHEWDKVIDAYVAEMSDEVVDHLDTHADFDTVEDSPTPASAVAETTSAVADPGRIQRVHRSRRLHAPNDDPRHAHYVPPLVVRQAGTADIIQHPANKARAPAPADIPAAPHADLAAIRRDLRILKRAILRYRLLPRVRVSREFLFFGAIFLILLGL